MAIECEKIHGIQSRILTNVFEYPYWSSIFVCKMVFLITNGTQSLKDLIYILIFGDYFFLLFGHVYWNVPLCIVFNSMNHFRFIHSMFCILKISVEILNKLFCNKIYALSDKIYQWQVKIRQKWRTQIF